MPGGLMQLNYAPSSQAQYIYGNPQITFWKAAYRRHTNFAMESKEISDMSVTPDFGKTVTYTIPRDTADLVHKMYFETVLPDPGSSDVCYCPYPGEKLLKKMSLIIGGTTIDTQYSDWLHVWNELTLNTEKKLNYQLMVGHRNNLVIDSSGGGVLTGLISVPLQFWFCRNAGLALPRKALERTTVEVQIEFEAAAKMGRNQNTSSGMTAATVSGSLTNPKLYADFIYLDTDESRRFLASRHEYLIEQVQIAPGINGHTINSTGTTTLKLNFTNSVKELIWITKNSALTSTESSTGVNDHFNYTRGMNADDAANEYQQLRIHGTSENIAGNLTLRDDPLKEAKIQFNGEDRLSAGNRNAQYFNLVQPYYHHTGHPSPGIYVYSFALRPEEFQPSGTVNMSRIDNSQLVLTFHASTVPQNKLIAFATNYNILIVTDGLANLVWG
tara:strand:+ start:876 stop:2201 length:1326 start_codon:yes stop_codon:yes gene_type:complete